MIQEVHENWFYVDGERFGTWSPAKTTLGDGDKSPLVQKGCFIGETSSGAIFSAPSLISQDAIDQRVRVSADWQRSRGIVDENGLTPAENVARKK